MHLSFSKSLLIIFLPLFIASCVKQNEENHTTIQPNSVSTQPSGEIEERGNCTLQIKINSITPSNMGWALAVRNPYNGNPYFLSSSISQSCGWGTPFNANLNTWYSFNAPSASGIKIDLGLVVDNTTCLTASAGPTINYTIKNGTSTVNRSIVWAGPTSLVYDFLNVTSTCSLQIPYKSEEQ